MNSLKEAFQHIHTDSTGVLQGTVISVNPLEIQMEGDEKHMVSGEVTCVPEHVKNLKTGDVLYILSTNKGKQYFVLGRRA